MKLKVERDMMNFNNIKRAALLLLAGVSIACSEGPDEMTDGSIPQEYAPIFSAEIINQPADESRAYVDEEDYYVKWEADDRISAFIKESAQQSPYILKTGAGEVTATFKAANTTVNQGDGTQNCAVYPECAGATFNPNIYAISYPMPAVQTYKQGRYAGLEPHLVAHLIDGEQFEFRTFTGYLALKLYTEETTDVLIKSIKLETPSGEPISGTMTISVVKELSGLKKGGQITTGTSSVTLDCGEGVVLSKNQSAPTLFAFALPVNARESDGTGGYVGMKFTVTDTQGRTMVLETKNRVGVARGRISTMAPRTFEPTPVVEAIDLSIAPDGSQQPSNCYVVTKPGRYKFPTLHVDRSTIYKYRTAKPSYDEFGWMWKTDGVEVSDIDYKYNETEKVGYMYFTVENFVPGNISIVARDKTETNFIFIHNWHIWFVDDMEEIEVKTRSGEAVESYTLLDRNIGAISANAADDNAHGFLYQWGRKDPLYNDSKGINMNPTINTYWQTQISSSSTLFSKWQWEQNHMPWEFLNNYPLTIMYGASNDNWFDPSQMANGPSVNYDRLWYMTKTNYDPCPRGYRVPSCDELYSIQPSTTAEGWELTDGSMVDLPFQNIINNNGISQAMGNAIIWTADPETSSYLWLVSYLGYIYCPSNYSSNGAYFPRASGIPVRCIKQ